MSLLSKILGAAVDKKLEKTVKSAVSGAVGNAVRSAVNSAVQSRPAGGESVPVSQPQPEARGEEGPSGFSWGPTIPAEENQFNYPGDYVAYFTHVFREDFPEYRVTHEKTGRGNAAVFTFWSPAGGKSLVAEILPESSETKKLRKECAAMAIPYVRFYHNHDGWWNTRAYVTQRVRNALR